MAEITQRRSPLGGRAEARDINIPDGGTPGVALQHRTGLCITQAAAYPGCDAALRASLAEIAGSEPDARPNRSVAAPAGRLIWTGPAQYWLVTEDPQNPASDLAEATAETAAITEQGHGRVCLRLSGRDARLVLAKGSTIDFHPSHFAAGDCAQTGLLSVSCLIDCIADEDSAPGVGPVFDLYSARSTAEHFLEWAIEAAAPHGCRILTPGSGIAAP
ncbi:MAG: sarcosine oxidase subunit gamma family protein [Alphaproteobacteria bacterium]|nr:sarcosine oxidase subunit gamma family protein [Alphaproteobacteria bacterium]